MNLRKLFFTYLLCFGTLFCFAKQETYLQHRIEKGETVFQIARKYQVTPAAIYKLNPEAVNGIQENTILLIPKKGSNVVAKSHKVQDKETLFSISKMYNVSVSDIEKWNKEALKNGLKVGQEITISKPGESPKKADLSIKPTPSTPSKPVENKTPKKVDVVPVEAAPKSTVYSYTHLVLPKETKFGIATQYDISVETLEQLNPKIKSGLKEGENLVIKTATPQNQPVLINGFYEVQAKETLFSLCNKFNISEEELYFLNPEIGSGLKEGMLLKIPEKKAKKKYQSNQTKISNLIETVDKSSSKELVLLLPLNIAKIENDSLKSKQNHLKSNKFLNLTLDFYAGALMAIDSARVLGLPVKVKIYDVESTKLSTNVSSIIDKNDFSKVDAVIGPFQSTHVDLTAQILAKNNIPVISPLSKERGLETPNLYYAIPSEETLKQRLFNYFEEKNGNVLAIISPKKIASKEYITNNYPETKWATFTDKGAVDFANLKSQLVKGKPNFVILDIEKSGTILSITNTLKNYQKEFDIQLVVFEVFDALNFEEIPIKNLASLKMLYPSANKVITTPEELVFAKKFKKENNMYPNAAAIKGFDITFDTLLRICQQEGFSASAAKHKTEYIENSFDYSNSNDLIQNNGCFLLYYDTDLTIKKIK